MPLWLMEERGIAKRPIGFPGKPNRLGPIRGSVSRAVHYAGVVRLRGLDEEGQCSGRLPAVRQSRPVNGKTVRCLASRAARSHGAHPRLAESGDSRAEFVRDGGPDTIRTYDLCLRRATLYPAELRVHTRLIAQPAAPEKPLSDTPSLSPFLAARLQRCLPSRRTITRSAVNGTTPREGTGSCETGCSPTAGGSSWDPLWR